jgi:hypothetical protein
VPVSEDKFDYAVSVATIRDVLFETVALRNLYILDRRSRLPLFPGRPADRLYS